jgi:four helix bundle protein
LKDNPIQAKSFQFAVDVVQLCYRLRDNHEYLLSKQLIRSGTSIGANVEEALAGQSRSDFISKMSIARKETRETRYWLRVIRASAITTIDVSHELAEAEELLRMLTAIIMTSREQA